MGNDVGKAYGFFYCGAKKTAVEAELPKASLQSRAPSALELMLIEGMGNVKGDPKLLALAKEAGQSGCNYLLQASLTGESGKEAARHLTAILNCLYASKLYGAGDKFRSDVVHLENGEYVLSE